MLVLSYKKIIANFVEKTKEFYNFVDFIFIISLS